MSLIATRSLLLALAAGALASVASAQQPAPRVVATLQDAEGSVLVSNPTGLAAGSKGATLATGVRVITPANARATIRFEDGCVVELRANQRFVVDAAQPCEARMLSAQSTLPQAQQTATTGGANGGLSGAALNGNLGTYAGYAGAATFALVGIDRWRHQGNGSGDNKEPPVSPN